MALPSSPPLFPEMGSEPPSSPPLLPASASAFSAAFSGPSRRKRQLSEYDSLSSDPLFSDDTSGAEDVTEYGQPKRKKMVKGPWYTLSQRGLRKSIHANRKKEAFRNVDSGVWMGSDGSEESADGRIRRLSVSDTSERRETMESVGRTERRAERAPVAQFTPETIAQRIVNDCVENGRETVDLSNVGLTHLSGSTIRPLQQLIRQTHFDMTQPPSEDEFTTLTPEIQLFLSKNSLSSLPSELFHLQNITVLSLRNNQLTDMPPAIAQLHKLKELNIAGNGIRCLPWEFLGFFDGRGGHRTINVRPNPLLEPTHISGPSPLADVRPSLDDEDLARWNDTRAHFEHLRERYARQIPLNSRSELELRLKFGRILRAQYLEVASRAGTEINPYREELIYLASSSVEYFDVDGTSHHPRKAERDISAVVPGPHNDPPSTISAVSTPSLFELGLRRVQETFSLDEIPSSLPDRVTSALSKAAGNLDLGNQKCSSCSRPFIIARAEWVEYWFSGFSSQPELTQETVLPFLRRACSWACAVPTAMGSFRC